MTMEMENGDIVYITEEEEKKCFQNAGFVFAQPLYMFYLKKLLYMPIG